MFRVHSCKDGCGRAIPTRVGEGELRQSLTGPTNRTAVPLPFHSIIITSKDGRVKTGTERK